jgi:hypothetical protein
MRGIPNRGRSGGTGSRGADSARTDRRAGDLRLAGAVAGDAAVADGDGRVGAVAFGAPPGLAWNPSGGPETFDAVQVGYLIAPADVALWTPSSAVSLRRTGEVEVVAVAPEAEAVMVRVDRAMARAGRGLEVTGTRAARQPSPTPTRPAMTLTLIEAETLDGLELPAGPGRARGGAQEHRHPRHRTSTRSWARQFVVRRCRVPRPALVRALRSPGASDGAGGESPARCARSSTGAACGPTSSATARSASATSSRPAEQPQRGRERRSRPLNSTRGPMIFATGAV